MKRTRYCKNCQAAVYPPWRVFLCKDCRRVVRWSFAAGGFVVGALIAVAKARGWL